MAEERVQRRLAAILAADVVGYSRLMERDEAGTLARLKAVRAELIDPGIAEHGGRIVKTMGDGVLVEFPSAVAAVENAVAIQAAMAERTREEPEDTRLRFRVGISLGDVIIDGDDIYGNGVNVAARLEGLCEPGGVYISGNVHDQVAGRISTTFDDLGEQQVKNIERPVRVYRVSHEARPAAPPPAGSARNALFDRPAVAVLPFENISGDPEQEYFADGLTEDVITALSLWRSFPVIARNSTFAYKGQIPDVRQVGRELGARYVIEGSVRKGGNRVRVTAQLIDAETGHHLWAERYDRELADIFDLQDELTHRIAAIIEPAIAGSERKRLSSKPPKDMNAWDLCIQGYSLIYQGTREENSRARELFLRAIELDPNYARAWTGLAYTYGRDFRLGFGDDREKALKNAYDAGRRAVALDETDSEARLMFARGLNMTGQMENALAEVRRAVELNPQNSTANWTLGVFLYLDDRAEEGIPWFEKALEMNPLDPRDYVVRTHLAVAKLCAGDYESAVDLARAAMRQRPDYFDARVTLGAALGHLGRAEDAREAVGEYLDRVQDYDIHPLFRRDHIARRFREGLRRAGLVD
jgi:adenylate cyclase